MRARADWPGLDNAILPPPYQTQILLDSKSGSSCYNNNNNNNIAHTHGPVPKSGTSTSCVLGGARLRRLSEGVIDFTGNNQLGLVEGVGVTSLKAELPL